MTWLDEANKQQYCIDQNPERTILQDFDKMEEKNQLQVIHMLLLKVMEKLDRFEKRTR